MIATFVRTGVLPWSDAAVPATALAMIIISYNNFRQQRRSETMIFAAPHYKKIPARRRGSELCRGERRALAAALKAVGSIEHVN